MKSNFKKVLVILGPTATGKTDVALSLAKKLDGELVSCDSRQVYQGLDIGTGKLPNAQVSVEKNKGYWSMDGVKIWMYDLIDPKLQYTVADYVRDATLIIEDILSRGKLPIIVGGTGLYLKGVLSGIPNLNVPVDNKLRLQLNGLSLIQLQTKLQKLSFKRWELMNTSDRQNPRRLVRAIELGLQKVEDKNFNTKIHDWDVLKIGLSALTNILYQRIDLRVRSRMNQGMLKEAQRLFLEGLSFERMKSLGLEYGILADFIKDTAKDKNEEDLIKTLQGKIHGYARRQKTWFKNEKDVLWFDITDKDYIVKVAKSVLKWYYPIDAT